ncbi:MAG: VanZ family protein [Candidatus Omnitrophota bacterium]
MLQVRNWLFKAFGGPAVITAFKFCFISVFLYALIYAFRKRIGPARISLIALLFAGAYLFAVWQPYFSEKTHLLTYGLVGYLSANDLVKLRERQRTKILAGGIIFVSLVSALDELFQAMLPYRIGELRDFITNIISGGTGMALLFILRKPGI